MFCSLLLILSATTAKRINRGPGSVPDTHDRDIIIIITLLLCRTSYEFNFLLHYCNRREVECGTRSVRIPSKVVIVVCAGKTFQKRSVAAGIQKNKKNIF